jgi:GNAT superfamily N-acetyltransferase
VNNLNQKNIKNLISLWETIGQSFQSHFKESLFHYVWLDDTDWPNRIWFIEKVTKDTLNTAIEIIQNISVPLTVSYWSGFKNELHPVFETFGFVKKSEQIGMSLALQKKFEKANRLNIKRITEGNQALAWGALYPQSFGYRISAEILMHTKDIIPYYLICLGDKPIGTAIIHQTEDVIGIHGISIIPEYRRQGFAEEAMAYFLNKAIDDRISFATLQSSALGKKIYLKMGFTEDFLMTNYLLSIQ